MNSLTLDLTKTKIDENNYYLHNPKAIALGYFDGLHRGHQELIRKMVQYATVNDLEATVLSFDRYPKPVPATARLNVIVPQPGTNQETEEILYSPLPEGKRNFWGLLQSSRQQADLLNYMGVNSLILQKFNQEYASLSPEEFCYGILSEVLNCQALFVGTDYHFAKNRSGDIAYLQEWAQNKGVKLFVVDRVKYDGEFISSTKIRNEITDGNLEEAKELLGRGYTIPGYVIHGNALGRTMGMPTANVRIPDGMVIPPYGVYESRTRVGDTIFNSLTSIGLRPTVNHTDPFPLVESYLLNQNVDLYGQYVEIELLKFERAEERFPSFIAMSAQLKNDLDKSRDFHNNNEDFNLYSFKDNVPVYISRSQRFNTSYFKLELYTPLSKTELIPNILLSRILTAYNNQYPSRPELKNYLDSQMASTIETSNTLIGNLQRLDFTLSSVNRGAGETDKFISLAEEFMTMLFEPAWDQFYNFPAEIIEAEKQNLKLEINRNYDSSKIEAMMRSYNYIQIASGNEAEIINNIDLVLAAIDAVDDFDLQRAWFRLFGQGHIRAFISGRFADDKLPQTVNAMLKRLPRNDNSFILLPGFNPLTQYIKPIGQRSEVSENEGDLAHIVFILGGLPTSVTLDELKAEVFTTLLAGKTSSLLNLRLKSEFAYTYGVKAKYNSFLGIISLYLDVEKADVDRIRTLISAVLTDIKNDAYSEAAFVSALRFFENTLMAINDDNKARLDYNCNNLVSGVNYSAPEALHYTAAITRDELNALAGDIYTVLDFVLTDKDATQDTETV